METFILWRVCVTPLFHPQNTLNTLKGELKGGF
jgi:hypothetical protein